jgi:hypothetical protein
MLSAIRVTKLVLPTVLIAVLAAPARADEYTHFSAPGAPLEPEGTPDVVIGPDSDDVVQTVDLPFPFPYFGRLQSKISICSNGWAAFGTETVTVSVNPPLPSTDAPDAVLAPLWDDLSTGSGSVRTYVIGSAPGRIFVVDWFGVQSFNGSSTDLRFQVALYETAGAVQFAYGSGGTFSGMSYTSGIEDPTGTIAFSALGFDNDLSERPTGIVRFEPRTTFVSGRLLRDRPVADGSGLGNSTETGLPVAGIAMGLLRTDTGEASAFGFTQANGDFVLSVPGIAEDVELALELITAGTGGTVVNASEHPYVFRLASEIPADPLVDLGDVTLDADIDAEDANIRRAVNIQQAIARGFRVATEAAEWGADNLLDDPVDTLDPVQVTWVPGAFGEGYVPSDGTTDARIGLPDSVANPNAYDDDVILREYGQHVLAELSFHPGQLTVIRDFAIETTEAFAWVDGFGFFFAAGVQERDFFVDTVSADTAIVHDLEMPPPSARGTTFPAAVAGSLWDLVDPANENEDEFEGTTGPPESGFVDVIAWIDRFIDSPDDIGGGDVTVRTFFDVFLNDGSAANRVRRPQIARIFIHHGTLPDDTLEPNDRVDEATDMEGAGSQITGLALSPDNEDVFRVDVPDGPPQRLTFVLNQPVTSIDLRLQLEDDEGNLLGADDNLGDGGSGRQTLRIEPTLPLAPGTYYVRARSASGDTGGYTFSVHLPFLLATGDLPTWTVGIPFKEDFAAAGGVAPYTFDTTENVPGLVVVENGTRLTGVPLTPGTFDVNVGVTDSTAPPNVVDEMRPLTINPPPTLPTLFGVAEGRDGSRLLGDGGTETEWTPLLQPTNGMTLVGGPDLRLEGSSGVPTTFPLSADALDAVGARLDGAGTFIVVTGDLFESDGAAIPVDDAFGYFVDALEGSEIDLTLRFRGEGPTPMVADVLDDFGGSLLTEGLVESFGRKVKIRDVIAQGTGRAHVLFTREGFVGTVRVTAKVRPPKKVRGESALTASGQVVEVPIDVLAGAKVKIDLRRSPAPSSLEPTVIEIEQPDGSLLALPTERRRGRKRAILKFEAEQDGRHLLRFTGRDGTTGPLFHKITIDTPRKARLVLD